MGINMQQTSTTRDRFVLVAIISALVLAGAVGWVVYATQSRAPDAAAVKPVPISTLRPRVGGNLSAFLAKYGQPMKQSSGGFDYLEPCPDGKTWRLAVQTMQSPTVIAVNGQLCDLNATLPADWRAIAGSFLPADAKLSGKVYDKIGGTEEYLYLSQSAKKQQDPSNPPYDCDNNPVPLGTVSLEGPGTAGASWQVTLSGC